MASERDESARRTIRELLSGLAPLLTLLRFLVAIIAPAVLIASAHAQTDPGGAHNPGDLINWYYAATFGTGIYTSGDRSVTVLQLPFSRALKNVDEDGWGLKVKLTSTLGFYDYNFDNVFSGEIPNRISTLSFLPGVEWEFRMTERWNLRPFVDAGYGQELSGRKSAWIYDFGVKSRFELTKNNGVEFALVNSLTSAGYRQQGETTNTFGYLATGLSMGIPTELTAYGRPLFLDVTPIYYYYFNRFSFAEFNDPQNRIREEFALAMSVFTRKPWSFKVFDVERVGVAIRNSGDVTGLTFFTSLPF